MSTAGPLSRRNFAKLAAAGAGAAVFGCSEGLLGPDRELVLTLAGTARHLDSSGAVTATHHLAPTVASGFLGAGRRVRPDRVSQGVGKLRAPAPALLGFTGTVDPPTVSHRTVHADDGGVIEVTLEQLGTGVPHRRTVRVPSRQVELIDRHEYHRSGNLSVLEQRIVEARVADRVVVDLTMEAAGEIRLTTGRPLRELVLGTPFLPRPLAAQDCGARLVFRFVAATASVVAALSTCVADGPFCLFAVVPALIDWMDCISAMEACGTEI